MFQVCTCIRLYSVKQNMEGDANLHHPSPRGSIKARGTSKFAGLEENL